MRGAAFISFSLPPYSNLHIHPTFPGQKSPQEMQALGLTCWNRAAQGLAVQGDEDTSPGLQPTGKKISHDFAQALESYTASHASSAFTLCSAATAISIIAASGSRVVSDCSARLGLTTSQLSSGLLLCAELNLINS
jgi:hypothetical protein